MPRSATTGVYTRASNSFSNPVFGTLIDPTDADLYFDDLDVGLNPPQLDGPVRIIDALQVGTTGTAAGTIEFFNATSGSITISPPTGALGGVTMTLPAATDTFVGRNTTDTLTNKTLTSPAINGATMTSPTINGATILTSTYNKVTITPPATSATLTLIDGTTLTGPAASGTVMTLGNIETVTGAKTFGAAGNVSKLIVAGNTSGSTVLNASAVASGTLTLPAATDTIVGKATTDTFTNKTFDTAGAGNSFSINGVTATANTGTGSVVRATSPTLITPTLGVATATSLVFSPTTNGIIGTTTNDDASAGRVGEYVFSTIASGSAVPLAGAGTVVNVTSISLTAGDWHVFLAGYFVPAATTNVAFATVGIATVSATLDTTPGRFDQIAPNNVPAVTFSLSLSPYRLSLSATTTVFFIARSSFTVSTNAVYGIIQARRIR
jgi:hypothetical protein